MAKMLVCKLEPGMRIAEDLTNFRGETLLYAGTELNETYIQKMQQLGLRYIQIQQDERAKQESNWQEQKLNRYVLSEKVCSQAVVTMKNILDVMGKGEKLDQQHIIETKQIVNEIIEEIINTRIIVENLEDYKPISVLMDELITKEEIFNCIENIRIYDECTFVHCINVCVMSVIMGLAFRYNKEKLMELGVGSLLHDLGKVRIPKKILNKPGKLTETERKKIEKHTQYTFETLREQQDISYLSALIAYQHHEKFDGQGYPQGLKGQEIHQYARIVAVADVYDALVTDRAYRPRMYSYQAAEIIQASSGTHFDPVVVKAFMGNIVIYPVGSPVELNNKARGVVVRTNKQMPARPVILIFYDQQGRHLSKPIEIDLTKNLTLFINRVFSNQLI